jgi:hypothetical protein
MPLQLTLLSNIVLDQLPPARCCPNHVSSPRPSTHAFSRQLPSIIYLRRYSCLTTDRLLLFFSSGYPIFVFNLPLFTLIYTFTLETRIYRPPTYVDSPETLMREAKYELDIRFISHTLFESNAIDAHRNCRLVKGCIRKHEVVHTSLTRLSLLPYQPNPLPTIVRPPNIRWRVQWFFLHDHLFFKIPSLAERGLLFFIEVTPSFASFPRTYTPGSSPSWKISRCWLKAHTGMQTQVHPRSIQVWALVGERDLNVQGKPQIRTSICVVTVALSGH